MECKVRAGYAEPKDYAVLAPGQSLETEVDLGRCHDLSAPGTYSVVAHYQDGNGNPPSAPAGAVHFAEAISAAAVSYTSAGKP